MYMCKISLYCLLGMKHDLILVFPLFTEPLAASVEDTGGVYFVPAFSGLYAPYWQTDARG